MERIIANSITDFQTFEFPPKTTGRITWLTGISRRESEAVQYKIGDAHGACTTHLL